MTQLTQVHSFDPLVDARWSRFLGSRRDSSIFHTVGWLDALWRTYGYKPIVFTTSAGSELEDGFLFCEVDSWLSGRRLVSIPFSDHAELLGSPGSISTIVSALKERVKSKTWKYVEIRPATQVIPSLGGFSKSEVFYWHKLNLQKTLDSLYGAFHKDCVQRKIRRATREKLEYAEGTSEELIQQFYGLFLLTRRRHGLPPQPISWFSNLVRCLRANIKIRVASVRDIPIASIITLTHNGTMTYKYGGSDPKYHSLGGMILLFWRAIQDAKNLELDEFDMGRSDCNNPGLIGFKEHWGAERHDLVYWSYPLQLRPNTNRWRFKAAKSVFSSLPPALLPAAGRLLYRHMG